MCFFPARGFKISQPESRENLMRRAHLNKQMLYRFPAKNHYHDAYQIIIMTHIKLCIWPEIINKRWAQCCEFGCQVPNLVVPTKSIPLLTMIQLGSAAWVFISLLLKVICGDNRFLRLVFLLGLLILL